jgi:alpha-1,2-mannosyltransferase
MRTGWAAAGRAALISLLPVVCGLYAAATFFGGSLIPWRPTMVDLDVYRRAGRLLLDGGDIYNLPGQLPFLYPPFAALLAVPLALLPSALVQIAWTTAGVLALLAVLHRFGLHGWVLSLVGSATVVLVGSVTETLAFGQLGIFLVALVLLDLTPGPRLLKGPRLLPQGTLTALATAIKLTPGIFLLYLIVTGRRRAWITTVVTGLVVTVVSAVVVPSASITFWGRLAHGDTGLGHSIIYYTNQSVMADVVRIFGLGRDVALVGLALSALVAALGVWAAAAWDRLDQVRWAVSLCGVAGLLASPVSWLHHFVWIVPLGLCLLQGTLLPAETADDTTADHDTAAPLALPTWFQVLTWLFVGWVVVSPVRRLPNGADVELQWNWHQQAVASVTAVLGIALLVAAGLVARRLRQVAGTARERDAVPARPAQG